MRVRRAVAARPSRGAVYGLGAFARTGLAAVAILLVGVVLSAVGYPMGSDSPFRPDDAA
ncbi:hypothetical protein [Streptomyces sp. DSM 15324]|uniref:hypothetical protein n=1 Tax=Streptomyces sp. DSM 15324 TaxID=1739111 RepID=UPI00131BB0D6|nr:hypothetical protein [Streptomyces sp. DSM 15324]